MMSLLSFISLSTLLIPAVFGWASYQSNIPNGAKVPDPCTSGQIWGGVGHQSAEGGDDRNPFGLDFVDNGDSWTVALCQADSDGDGRSNGAELGDPNCVFITGSAPARTTNITHPGICEPPNSPQCQGKNTFLPDSCTQLVIGGTTYPSSTFWLSTSKLPASAALTVSFSVVQPSTIKPGASGMPSTQAASTTKNTNSATSVVPKSSVMSIVLSMLIVAKVLSG